MLIKLLKKIYKRWNGPKDEIDCNNSLVHMRETVNSIPGIRFRIKGRGNKIVVSDNITNKQSYINNSLIHINGDNNLISIDENAFGVFNIEIMANECLVEIRKKTGSSGSDIKLWENNSKVILGECSIIARETRFYATDFHSIVDYNTKKPINRGEEIVLGSHCWIGEGVKILKNTHINDDIVVATGSIVTKDLTESHSIYAGIPARIVKRNVSWNYEKFDILKEKYEF